MKLLVGFTLLGGRHDARTFALYAALLQA